MRIRYEDAKTHALVLAIVGWLFVILSVGLGSTNRSRFGPLKWTDFVHFYTLGDIARSRDAALLYDANAQHVRQVALVPESGENRYLPVYGPQVSLIFAPFSRAPYLVAGLLWGAVSLAIYLTAVWMAWRPSRRVLGDTVFLAAGVMAFPPLWQLVSYGQTTAVPLVAFAAGWLFSESNRRVLAGFALGLLAVKPQHGLVLAAVMLWSREWRMIIGIVLSIACQIAGASAWFGWAAWRDYALTISRLPAMVSALEPDDYKLHSLRAITGLLPDRWDLILWLATSAFVVAITIAMWRRRDLPVRIRFGVLVLSTALVSPHLTIYDVSLLALPVVWIGGWLLEQHADSTWFWQRVYWLTAALLVPTAAFVKVQLSVLILLDVFVRLAFRLRESASREPLASGGA
ncbi:MAG TPA: glycosyltransferase family 87 protein [Vicinamibacterales bacterium]|nr:glycosyltransferase family 87 protein [Vicinamibacterales bacterium]